MKFSVDQESVSDIIFALTSYSDDIDSEFRKFEDEIKKIAIKTNYNKLLYALQGIIDIYNDVICGSMRKQLLAQWIEEGESLHSFAEDVYMGEESEEAVKKIENSLEDIFLTKNNSNLLDVEFEGESNATSEDFHDAMSCFESFEKNVETIKNDYNNIFINNSEENELYRFLIPIIESVGVAVILFLDSSKEKMLLLEENYDEKMEAEKEKVRGAKEDHKPIEFDLDLFDFEDDYSVSLNNTTKSTPIITDKQSAKIDKIRMEEINEEPSSINDKLTNIQVETIRKETGWSDRIIKYLRSMAEYKIYRDADLREIVIGNTCALIRRDLNWEQKDSKGLTNAQRIKKGRAPLDENGISIELHHIGQHADSPLAELSRDDHRGKGNDTILHDKSIQSEAHGEGNNWDKERAGFWKERNEFNNFYKEKFEPEVFNIGKDKSLSTAEKIKKIQEVFGRAKYKRDINVPSDIQYVKGFYDNGAVEYDWPPKLGFEKMEPITKERTLPERWDRYGFLGGSNFSDIPETGKYSYSERAIPYVENEDAYHFGEFRNDTYFDKIDAIRTRDYEQLKYLLSKEGMQGISEEYFEEMCDDYEDFIVDIKNSIGSVDATYGLQGTAHSWGSMVGGAKQFVTPLNGETLRKIGVLIERK